MKIRKSSLIYRVVNKCRSAKPKNGYDVFCSSFEAVLVLVIAPITFIVCSVTVGFIFGMWFGTHGIEIDDQFTPEVFTTLTFQGAAFIASSVAAAYVICLVVRFIVRFVCDRI